jgi:hypothetical protein
MRKFYPFFSKTLLITALALFSFESLKAQTGNCGPVTETFDNTGGTMAGFTSHLQGSVITPGFTFGMTGQNGYLQLCDIPGGSSYKIITPTYVTSTTQTRIGYGFDLTGAVNVTEVYAFINYFNTVTNQDVSIYLSTAAVNYTGTGNNRIAVICDSVLISNLQGFNPGDEYSLEIFVTADTNTQNNQCAVIDNFRTTGINTQPALVNNCGPIAEDFNNTGGSTAGFTSSTQGNPASPGFTYGMTGQNGYLQRCETTAGAVYQIISPTYQSAVTQSTVKYGFDLGGNVSASEVNIWIEFTNSVTGQMQTIHLSTIIPSYTGGGNNQTAVICDSTLFSIIPGFNPGDRYRIYALITTQENSQSNQCITFDNFRTSGFVALIPLPVNFTHFAGKNANETAVLTWSVSGEKDVLRYIVEKSANGTNFVKIGEIAASGASTYSFTDNKPQQGLNFYRIRNEDADGKFKFSSIVRMNFGKNIAIRAFPMPAGSSVTIEHGAVERSGKIALMNANGQVIRQIDVMPELTQTQINLSGLNSGVYIVRFDNGSGKIETLKIVKQ